MKPEHRYIKSLAHIAINVTDLDKSVDFYCNGLGLRKAFELRIPETISEEMPGSPLAELIGKPAIVYIETGNNTFIELFHPLPGMDLSTAGPNFDKMGFLHLSLAVENLAGFLEQLRQRSIPIVEEMKLGPDHTWQAWIADPDGNRIELMEYTPESLQINS